MWKIEKSIKPCSKLNHNRTGFPQSLTEKQNIKTKYKSYDDQTRIQTEAKEMPVLQ